MLLRKITDLSLVENKRRWIVTLVNPFLTSDTLIEWDESFGYFGFVPSNKHLNMSLERCTPGCCVCSQSSWPTALRVPSLSRSVSVAMSSGRCVSEVGGMWGVWKARFSVLTPAEMLIILSTWIQVSFPSSGKKGAEVGELLSSDTAFRSSECI